jgi:dethiobiotin synthetase
MAAELMGLAPFTLADLVSELHWPHGTHVGLVEQAGGLGSPQAGDGDGADMVDLLQPDRVVLVAGAGLGTLSNIRLAARALSGHPLVVFLNRFDPGDELHAANRRWLIEHNNLAVAVATAELAELVLGR